MTNTIIKLNDNEYNVLNADWNYITININEIDEDEKNKILNKYKEEQINNIATLSDQILLIANILAEQIEQKSEDERTDIENKALDTYYKIINILNWN